MAMSFGPHGGFRANINMTPMIDVLLVLIIIFMVITPTTSRGLNALVPQPESGPAAATPSDDVVVTVNGDRTVSINQETVALADLPGRLNACTPTTPVILCSCAAGRGSNSSTSFCYSFAKAISLRRPSRLSLNFQPS